MDWLFRDTPLAKHTPVLIGIGTASRCEEKSQDALEPMDLMLEAVSNAGKDSGNAMTLSAAQ